tara:strand:- start:3358 stop:3654 length:297 start_codon:yes stop_codon:yes gene_type:complete
MIEKTEQDRFALIANAVANATKIVPQEFKGLLDELKAEALAEKFVIEHGVQNASKQEIEQEFVSLDAVENDKDDEDFDQDENLVDMDAVSEEMRGIFE